MRRRSLRLLSPDRLHNSDGDTGAFFRVKNYQREFCVPKTGGLNVEGIVPPSYLLEEDLTREAGLMMDFYGGIWKNYLIWDMFL
mgnify:CR=1 FL=1